MGLMRNIIETVGENIVKGKEEKNAEREFVQNNKGTEAICAFMVHLFEKGNEGYNWVKDNHVGLYPVIYSDSVALCYMHVDGQSIRPKDAEVARYSFQEMYNWYGLGAGVGYTTLNSRIQFNVLEDRINIEVQKLPHIKYNNGFLVKLFQ